ncbi:hypothetical protein CDAR_437661 [Caerostris darwini]|uniref:Uncharacterized protein n=1 Tax=Caerostris darwini TaxID=1538125 RepID=A0AAV4NVF0_9ARAC|nr:hypothetical protein CDAR_437661 [Caerostris darwini]
MQAKPEVFSMQVSWKFPNSTGPLVKNSSRISLAAKNVSRSGEKWCTALRLNFKRFEKVIDLKKKLLAIYIGYFAIGFRHTEIGLTLKFSVPTYTAVPLGGCCISNKRGILKPACLHHPFAPTSSNRDDLEEGGGGVPPLKRGTKADDKSGGHKRFLKANLKP